MPSDSAAGRGVQAQAGPAGAQRGGRHRHLAGGGPEQLDALFDGPPLEPLGQGPVDGRGDQRLLVTGVGKQPGGGVGEQPPPVHIGDDDAFAHQVQGPFEAAGPLGDQVQLGLGGIGPAAELHGARGRSAGPAQGDQPGQAEADHQPEEEPADHGYALRRIGGSTPTAPGSGPATRIPTNDDTAA